MANKIRFIPALMACKFFTWYYGIRGDRHNDRAGFIANYIDPQFIAHTRKPKNLVAITGTNGKTTSVSLLTQILELNGEKFSSNNWGANVKAAFSWAVTDGVSLFNRLRVDRTVIELDELTSRETVPMLKPNYMIITNLGRDSMLKNATPETITASLKKAIELSPQMTLILNGDDPLSCFLGENNRRIYFGVADMKNKVPYHISNDFGVCPVCGAIPQYSFRNYRHIGEFHCPKCGLRSPEKDYLCIGYDENQMTVREKDGQYSYPVVSATIYNIYNQTAIIAFLRDSGYSPEKISELLKKVHLPEIREEQYRIGNIDVVRKTLKGQNASAASTVLESLVREEGRKEIIFILDEVRDETGLETVNWIWDSDFHLLNDPSVKRIILSGERHLDHRVRMLTAGVDPGILTTVHDDQDSIAHLTTEGIDKIYVVNDVYAIARSRKTVNSVLEFLREQQK